jgi:hypothetical protein
MAPIKKDVSISYCNIVHPKFRKHRSAASQFRDGLILTPADVMPISFLTERQLTETSVEIVSSGGRCWKQLSLTNTT